MVHSKLQTTQVPDRVLEAPVLPKIANSDIQMMLQGSDTQESGRKSSCDSSVDQASNESSTS
jgi:hypothetical protein